MLVFLAMDYTMYVLINGFVLKHCKRIFDEAIFFDATINAGHRWAICRSSSEFLEVLPGIPIAANIYMVCLFNQSNIRRCFFKNLMHGPITRAFQIKVRSWARPADRFSISSLYELFCSASNQFSLVRIFHDQFSFTLVFHVFISDFSASHSSFF